MCVCFFCSTSGLRRGSQFQTAVVYADSEPFKRPAGDDETGRHRMSHTNNNQTHTHTLGCLPARTQRNLFGRQNAKEQQRKQVDRLDRPIPDGGARLPEPALPRTGTHASTGFLRGRMAIVCLRCIVTYPPRRCLG